MFIFNVLTNIQQHHLNFSISS